jgi:DNA-directed RNA polymerase alpha subunit
MLNRVKTIEVTKAYAKAFNERDLVAIGALLDDDNIVFTRQTQGTIAGKEAVMRRIRNLFWRLDKQDHLLFMANGIVDVGKTKMRPCLVGVLNGVRSAVCLISCKANGQITTIAILTQGEVLEAARLTEEVPLIFQMVD